MLRCLSGLNPVWPSQYPSFALWMTLLCPRRLTCCSTDGCLPSGQGVPALSSGPQQAGRQIGRGSGTSISCLRAGDKTTVPCHHAGDKTRLLFTDHTSTLYHLTPGSSKACWVDDTPRKMDLSNLRSKHINYPGIGLSMCRGSWFQFSWDVACKILISRLHIYFAFISCYTGIQMEILNNICHISLNLVGIH